MNKKIMIALTLIFMLAAIIACTVLPEPEGYSVTSEKDSSYSKKVERIHVIAEIEEHLRPIFAYSFEHSLISAFQSNGVQVLTAIGSSESDSSIDNGEKTGIFAPDATLRISIYPLYRTRDDGYQAIVGINFEAILVDNTTNKNVWHATGKVDYIVKFGPSPDYS
jgi:hypothetical protein